MHVIHLSDVIGGIIIRCIVGNSRIGRDRRLWLFAKITILEKLKTMTCSCIDYETRETDSSRSLRP